MTRDWEPRPPIYPAEWLDEGDEDDAAEKPGPEGRDVCRRRREVDPGDTQENR